MAPDLLPCGADRSEVVDAALADVPGPVGHDAGCAHCAAARDHAATRWEALRHDLAAPEPPPASVSRAVFARVRSVRSGDRLALPAAGPGRTIVASAALAELARRVARPVAGVRSVGEVTVATDADGGLALAVEVEADLARSLPLPGVAASVRHAVSTTVSGAAGLAVTTVDVTIR